MRLRWAIAGLALVLAGCGSTAEPSRLDLTTPGVHTGEPIPSATATPEGSGTATPKATPAVKPVTSAEKRVIKGWSDRQRRGDMTEASRYFSVPALISDADQGELFLSTPGEVKKFNSSLKCATKLMGTRRGAKGFAVGIFMLSERKGQTKCGVDAGQTTEVAFQIRKQHIQQWVRIAVGTGVATPTPTPTQTPTASPTPTATVS
jgi:hypothetical protein